LGELDVAEAQSQRAQEAEARLLERLRERSSEACAELYDRFAPGIHRFAVARLGGDVQGAEDVVVETMAAVVRDIGRFKPRRSSLPGWVFGIARRRIQMEIRRQRRRKAPPVHAQVSFEAIREASDGGDLAAAAASRLDARRRVAELRGLLTDTEFEALALSCVAELSAREIAQVVGRSERAVHSILHRARTKARERLVNEDD
jgi:RNA polymerase sigma-70 factor (ECF subfamily)